VAAVFDPVARRADAESYSCFESPREIRLLLVRPANARYLIDTGAVGGEGCAARILTSLSKTASSSPTETPEHSEVPITDCERLRSPRLQKMIRGTFQSRSLDKLPAPDATHDSLLTNLNLFGIFRCSS
jgi:hypothetical protein